MKSNRTAHCGARLNLPRDLQAAYTIGRMGAVCVADVFPLFWGAITTARAGFRRLSRLRLIRSFERPHPSFPKWFSLTEDGRDWVVDECGCDEAALRVVVGLGRMNLSALSSRNRFWTSLVLAARRTPNVKLALFRPEWHLRNAKSQQVSVVPDALAALTSADLDEHRIAWMIELDSGAERSAVWKAKARAYCEARGVSSLYGERRWNVLAVVPSRRRARTVAAAVAEGGAGSFTMIGIASQLELGRTLDSVLWLARDLATDDGIEPRRSLIDAIAGSSLHPSRQPRASVDWGEQRERAANSR